jgi:indole-3-glycerol phosphate synthase
MDNLAERINTIQEIIGSGYYERLAPPNRERKSVCESIEKMQDEGKFPILAEIATALPSEGMLFSSRKSALSHIEKLCDYNLCALDLWLEPRFHAGDLRWLSKNFRMPVIARDYIISEKQIVGGDAVVLDFPLLNHANIDEHELMEAAHDLDLEVIAQVTNASELSDAKKSEADIIMINNSESNGNGADISITLKALTKNKTARPVISAHGINSAQDVRSLVVAGVNAVEMSARQSCNGSFEQKFNTIKNAIYGKTPGN